MWECMLIRPDNLKQWSAVSRSPDEAIETLSRELGINLYICGGVGEFRLTCRRRDNPSLLFEFDVAEGRPSAVATVGRQAAGYSLKVMDLSGTVLLDEHAANHDDAREQIAVTLASYGIKSTSCHLMHRGGELM